MSRPPAPIELSVSTFIRHLDSEAAGAVLVSTPAFLAFLRAEFRARPATKRALLEAARCHALRGRVSVSALPDERLAAKAVVFAYMQLAASLIERGVIQRPVSHFRVRRASGLAPRPAPTAAPRFDTVQVAINGRLERLERYPADITWSEAAAFQRSAAYDLPEIDVVPERACVGATMHFPAAEHPTGYGVLYVDREPVERVRCWELEN